MSEEIHGRKYKIVPPLILPKTRYKGKKPYAKIIVDGCNHRSGKPIRFRSLRNAERYIRQHGLEIGQ